MKANGRPALRLTMLLRCCPGARRRCSSSCSQLRGSWFKSALVSRSSLRHQIISLTSYLLCARVRSMLGINHIPENVQRNVCNRQIKLTLAQEMTALALCCIVISHRCHNC